MFSEKKLIFVRGVLLAPEVKFDEIKELFAKNKFISKSDDVILVLYDIIGQLKESIKKRLSFLKTLGDVKEFFVKVGLL